MTVGTTLQPHLPTSNTPRNPLRNFPLNFFASPNQNQNHQLLTDAKGLLNGPGQNNCFLNCAVQVSFVFELIFALKVEMTHEVA